jgi:capsular polysaccharide biosynthesis protein
MMPTQRLVDDGGQMSLLEYGRIVIQRGWIIVLTAVLAAAALFAFSARQTPIYRSTQTVIIQPASANQGINQGIRSLLNAYVVYLNSSFIAEQIADSLGMDVSGAELKGRAEIAANPDTMSIEINVNDTDGEMANRVALAWGQQLVDFRNRENQALVPNQQINAALQDLPRYVQYRPRTLVNMALGGLAGILLGGLIVFALEFTRHRVVAYREDLEDLLHIPVLAAIPEDVASSHSISSVS